MRPPAILALVALLLAPASASDPGPWRIQFDGYGLARLTYDEVKEALGATGPVPSNRLALMNRDRVVPVLVEDGGDGTFGPGDRLLFFSPDTSCPTTNTTVYHLLRDTDKGTRLQRPTPPSKEALAGTPGRYGNTRLCCKAVGHAEGSRECRVLLHPILMAGAARQPDGSPGLMVRIELTPPGKGADSGEPIRMVLKTPRRQRSLVMPSYGELLVPYSPEEDGLHGNRFSANLTLDRKADIRLGFCSPRPWDNGCSTVHYRRKAELVTLPDLSCPTLLAWDVERKRLVWNGRLPGGKAPVLDLQKGRNRILLSTPEGLLEPRRIWRVEAAPPPPAAGKVAYLALAPRRFLATLEPHLARRRAELGSAGAVALEDLYRTRSGSQPDPRAILSWLRETGKGVRYLLLVGTARRRLYAFGNDLYYHPAQRHDTFNTLPPMPYHPGGRKGGSPYTVDALYGDLDGDGLAEVAVGRIPARTPAELKAVLDKIARYESRPPAVPAGRRIHLQAGLGRYNTKGNKMLGSMLENMLEGVARGLVDEFVPPLYDMEAIYSSAASGYFFDPARFRQQVSLGLEKGFFAAFYIGHGATRRYDTFRWRGKRYQTFLAEDAAALRLKGPQGLYFALTCLSGTIAQVHHDLCLAGELCLNPHGPVGAVGSSGTVDDRMNLLVVVTTLDAFFRQRPARHGDLLRKVQAGLATARKHPQVAMILGMLNKLMRRSRNEKEVLQLVRYQYTLYGDPALRIHYPGLGVELKAPGPVAPGDTLEVSGRAARLESGTAWVMLELPRHLPRRPLHKVTDKLSARAAGMLLGHNNKLLNQRRLASVKVPLVEGRFTARIPVPETVRGRKAVVQVYLAGPGGQAAGCREVKLAR